MTYSHRPALPPVLEAEGLGGPADGMVRLIRHSDGPRPWLIWVHGTGMGGPADIPASRSHRFFSRLGFNIALPIQPGQGVRRGAWPAYPAVDPINNVAGMMRTISEVRAVVRWVQPQATSVTVAGLSLGSAVAAFVSYLEPQVDAVALYVPILGLNQMIAQHQQRWGSAGAEIGRVMHSDAVSALTSVVDPLAVEPAAPTDRRLIVGAWHDRMALRSPAEVLNEKWQGKLHWHDGGHVGVMFSSNVTSVTEDFLRQVVSA
jgi:pimeloyl-ACP methyl ester carboxylesterase